MGIEIEIEIGIEIGIEIEIGNFSQNSQNTAEIFASLPRIQIGWLLRLSARNPFIIFNRN